MFFKSLFFTFLILVQEAKIISVNFKLTKEETSTKIMLPCELVLQTHTHSHTHTHTHEHTQTHMRERERERVLVGGYGEEQGADL